MSSDVHSNGLFINNEDEYKAFVLKKHTNWKDIRIGLVEF